MTVDSDKSEPGSTVAQEKGFLFQKYRTWCELNNLKVKYLGHCVGTVVSLISSQLRGQGSGSKTLSILPEVEK